MKCQPIIGITANYSYDGSSEFAEGIGAREQEWQLLADDYIDCIVRAGGIPVILPLVKNKKYQETVRLLADGADAILFSGGNDVDPMRFGQTTAGKTGGIIPERDEQEFFLLRYVLEHTEKPVLGVCRGIQLMNAVMGGTLIQHIPDAGYPAHTLPMYPRQMASHWVNVEPGSLLHGITGRERLGVNSFHHMAVEECAPGLVITARAEDGVIEAVELADNRKKRFFLGVQWHPEMMAWADAVQQKIISAFVKAAAAGRCAGLLAQEQEDEPLLHSVI